MAGVGYACLSAAIEIRGGWQRGVIVANGEWRWRVWRRKQVASARRLCTVHCRGDARGMAGAQHRPCRLNDNRASS